MLGASVPLSVVEVGAIAERLLAADTEAGTLAPISQGLPAFDLAAAYDVLAEIASRRRDQGWTSVGRKIGFTNRTIWAAYGVDRPMWADIWDHTVRWSSHGEATVPLAPFVEPRIEPEVVFKLAGPVPVTDDPVEMLHSVEWLAAGFEIVRCPFPGWRFTLPDCTAAFGLHGALIVGEPVAIDSTNRDVLAEALATSEVTLSRVAEVVDRGTGANVLGSPVLALTHLARVLQDQPQFPRLAAGEIVTTGTITDAWPVAPGETWTSSYGSLGLDGLTVTFT
jgi:2-oxo-3-hexenedioate decarboxylase